MMSATHPLRLLILGGTGYIGPHHVHAALERGHRVTVFSRGTHPLKFAHDVEHLLGDRSRDLSTIMNRDWDAVLDLATFGPVWVRTLGEALGVRVQHYTFISSQDSYAHPDTYPRGTDELKPVRAYTDASDPYSLSHVELYKDPDFDSESGKRTFLNIERAKQMYGSLKVLCEREAERQFPQRALILRPGFIVGAGDPNPAFTYWVERMSFGGELLAAGDPSYPVQIIDVRDVARWVIAMIEQSVTGVYNIVGPPSPLNLGDLLERIRVSLSVTTRLVWVPVPWLLQQKLWPMGVLFWATERGGFNNPGRLNFDKALARGLSFRPFEETVSSVLAWRQAMPKAQQGTVGGITRDGQSGRFEPANMPWPQYLAEESALLANWRRESDQIRQ